MAVILNRHSAFQLAVTLNDQFKEYSKPSQVLFVPVPVRNNKVWCRPCIGWIVEQWDWSDKDRKWLITRTLPLEE